MGSYLSTNLWIEFSINKDQVKENGFDQNQLLDFLKNEADLNTDIYSLKEVEDNYIFQLRPEIIASDFLPFLEEFYTIYRHKIYAERVLEPFRAMASDKWKAYIENGENEDIFSHADYSKYSTGKGKIRLNADTWQITVEGKVMAEEMEAHLNLFSYTLKRAFKHYQIAQALDVILI